MIDTTRSYSVKPIISMKGNLVGRMFFCLKETSKQWRIALSQRIYLHLVISYEHAASQES